MPKIVVLVLGIFLVVSLLFNIKLLSNQKSPEEVYKVANVIDGDTFKLENGKRVRLLGVNTPEIGRCDADRAKKILEKEISGKNVKLTDNHPDPYGRIIANVFVEDKYINDVLIKRGAARPDYDSSNPYMKQLEKLYTQARKAKIGVNSEKCLPTKPPSPKCNIKGNIGRDNKFKAYYYPGCSTYGSVQVDLSAEDQWFCSEKEAEAAGFIKAPTCK